jgi:hypothetical protein
VAGKAKDLCDATGLDCTAATFKIGIGARYAFAPFARNTPWISAVIAREGTGLTLKGPGGDESIAFGGWEWLRLGAGWDWRFNRTFGLGAFTSFSLATYNGISTNNNGMYVVAGDLGGGKTHTWFVLGVRAILFP